MSDTEGFEVKLVGLRLHTIDPPESGCFPRLKVLHLRVCSDNVPLMEKLYSCSPVLEVLTIEGIMDLGDADDDVVYNFKISVLELKTLRIDLVCRIYNTRLDVYINNPKLENLDLKMDGFSNYFLLGRAKSLVNATMPVSVSHIFLEKNLLTFPTKPLHFWMKFLMFNICLFRLVGLRLVYLSFCSFAVYLIGNITG